MNSAGMIKAVAACLAVVGLCLPQPLLAAVRTGQSITADVALQPGNVLSGRVLDHEGAGQGGVPVLLLAGGQRLMETRTDQHGSFAFANLRGGVYQVASPGAVGVYRVWRAGTAPPNAQPTALIVTGQDLVRGQRNVMRWLTNPLVIAGVVAAAVAIPIAIVNAERDDPASSS